jgi:hypothetical protein
MGRISNVLGNVAKHILSSLERAFRMMAITGFIVAIIAGLSTEVIGSLLTKEIPPSGPTHLAAAAIAVTFGYAAAVTVAIGEILRGIIRGIELIVAETEHLAQEGLHDLEGIAERGGQDALRLGRAAVGDVAGLGHGVVSGAESLEHGIAERFRGAEHGIASRVTGRSQDSSQDTGQNSAAPTTVPTTNPPQYQR